MKKSNERAIRKAIENFYGRKVPTKTCIYSVNDSPHAAINLSFALEKEFGFEFGDEIRRARTIGGLVALTMRKIASKEKRNG